MKKASRAALTFLALWAGWPGVASAVEQAGRVLAVRREAVVEREAGSLAAKPEMELALRDAVRTGEQSRAKLFFRDDSILNLGERSRVQVAQYLYSPEKQRSRSVYQLLDGSLKVVVGRSDLEVHTPTAVAAARGTSFFVWSDGPARSCLMVLDGEVALRNLDEKIPGEVRVGAGFMSCVPRDAPPAAGRPLDAGLLESLSAGTFVMSGEGAGGGDDLPPGFRRGGGGVETIITPPLPQQPPSERMIQPPPPPPPPPPPGPPPEEQR